MTRTDRTAFQFRLKHNLPFTPTRARVPRREHPARELSPCKTCGRVLVMTGASQCFRCGPKDEATFRELDMLIAADVHTPRSMITLVAMQKIAAGIVS